MASYADNIVIEYYNGAAWIDISSYVVDDITYQGGLGGWRPENRVAVLGTIELTLNNKAKLFSPMGGDVARGLNTLSGFTRGARLRVRVTFGGITKTVCSGYIHKIDSDDKNWGDEQTHVTALDWMTVPANFPMKGAQIATNKTIDQAMALVLARLSVQPDDTDFDAGTATFPTVFDNVKNVTMASGELVKLANSEPGYIYVKANGTLRVENATARPGARALDQVITHPDDAGRLLLEDGTYLLLEDGGKLILDEPLTVGLFSDAESYNILMGPDALINAAIVRAYPVATDTSLKVLYSLGTPLFMRAGSSLSMTAHYTDPNGLGQCAGTNMQTPVATTDYLANSQSGGGGTDYTANLSVTATYYGDTVEYVLVNAGNYDFYVTKLQARGYGIYYGNSIEYRADDAASQNSYGYSALQFDQKYRRDTSSAAEIAGAAIAEYRTPKSRITKVSYLANLNNNHLMSFLGLDIGSLIRITEDRSTIDNHYYITDRGFTIKQGGIINVVYGLKQNDSYLSGGLSPITVEFTAANEDRLNYGPSARLSNLTYKTVSAWIYVKNAGNANLKGFLAKYGGGSGGVIGWRFFVHANANLYFTEDSGASQNQWYANGAISLNQWIHVVAVVDRSGSLPVVQLYKNGALLTFVSSSTFTMPSESGVDFIVGALVYYSAGVAQVLGFDGMIFDARVYDRLLSPAEIATLYNAGTPDESLVQDGILYQGPAVYSDDVPAAGTVLASTDRPVENAFRMAAVPYGSPTVRANP